MNQEPTPDEVLAGLIGVCCCFIFVVGLVALVAWLVRRAAKSSSEHPERSRAPDGAPAQLHLSVIAIALDAALRPALEQQLLASTPRADPVTSTHSVVLRVARLMLDVAPQWRRFGYGEKELSELRAAQESYVSAAADFRGRAALPGDAEDGLTVLTLVLCTRGRRLGVDRLDAREQIHALLEDRIGLEPSALAGAEYVWAPRERALSEALIAQRFPELHALAP